MIGVIFIAADFRKVMTALAKTKAAVKFRAKNISYQMAIDYLELIRINIINQRYSGFYSQYNVRYEEWKQKITSDSRFWILKGDLLQSLTIWKENSFWRSGIPPGILDSGGKSWTGTGEKGNPAYIGAYARILEYGGVFDNQVHPPRPLFRPSLTQYEGTGAPKRVDESANIILRSWK
jgi:hypothetical protein